VSEKFEILGRMINRYRPISVHYISDIFLVATSPVLATGGRQLLIKKRLILIMSVSYRLLKGFMFKSYITVTRPENRKTAAGSVTHNLQIGH